jgi:GH24 family phage-related lysozyme (muramidase)
VAAIDRALDRATDCAQSTTPPPRSPGPAPRTLGQAGTDLIKRWESCGRRRSDGRFEAYPDPGSAEGRPWTIGWGSTRYANGRSVTLHDEPIGAAEAYELMIVELTRACAAVDRLCPGQSQAHRGALADFTYNLGAGRLKASTLRECVNEGDYCAAQQEFGKWVWARGRRLAGLVARRSEEAALFGR